jgi:hypothetical protein
MCRLIDVQMCKFKAKCKKVNAQMTKCPLLIWALPAARAIRSYCAGFNHMRVSAPITNAVKFQREKVRLSS